LVSEYAPCEFHGIAIRVRNLAAELTKQGHEVKVFTSRTREQLREEGYKDEKNLILFHHMGFCVTNMWNAGNRICVAPGLTLLKALIWDENKPDVVHLFFPTTIAYVLLMICRLRGIATYCSHHVDMNFYMDQYMQMLGARAADRMVMPSARKALGEFCALLSHSYYNSQCRLPAWLFSDLNVAPTVAAMEKEFRCFTGRVDRLTRYYNSIYPYFQWLFAIAFRLVDRLSRTGFTSRL